MEIYKIYRDESDFYILYNQRLGKTLGRFLSLKQLYKYQEKIEKSLYDNRSWLDNLIRKGV